MISRSLCGQRGGESYSAGIACEPVDLSRRERIDRLDLRHVALGASVLTFWIHLAECGGGSLIAGRHADCSACYLLDFSSEISQKVRGCLPAEQKWAFGRLWFFDDEDFDTPEKAYDMKSQLREIKRPSSRCRALATMPSCFSVKETPEAATSFCAPQRPAILSPGERRSLRAP